MLLRGRTYHMNAQDCLDELRSIKDVSFSTVDEQGLPHSRIIDIMIVGDNKLYFCTARGKDFYQQLMHNPHVAVVGLNRNWQMIRLTGTVQHLDDQKKWIDRIFDENPSMKNVYPKDTRYILESFVISSGATEFFDLGKEPIHRERFPFGGAKIPGYGFLITDSCIGCGTCRRNCPQNCIEIGKPFVIRQDHCLHCGSCLEKCPVKAIVRR